MGLVETKSHLEGAPDELSIYVSEAGRQPEGNRLRRFTLRIDGFVSVKAPMSGCELITRPIVFDGNNLCINFSTSAAGNIRVEIQDADGKPVDGFRLADCPEIFGDELERVVNWKNGSDLSKLAGMSIRLRFVMKDSDLYSIRFRREK